MRSIVAGDRLGHRLLSVAVAAVLLAGLLLTGGALDAEAQKRKKPKKVQFWLTVLHNNDGESNLINAGGDLVDFGGIARFATKVDDLRKEADRRAGRRGRGKPRAGSVLISSGDNFLAGPQLNASFERNERNGDPYYDSVALSLIDYDAMTIGNHEFDFGPDVLATFIDGFAGQTPFISSNLDVSGEPSLAALADDGIITGSTVVEKDGQEIGIVGATTELLPTISSPRNVVVEDVLSNVQAEVDELVDDGVKKIILSSHLQGIDSEIELTSQLTDVDVVIAGGGDELLADEDDVLVPGDDIANAFSDYPFIAEDADGNDVPIVTTPGNYKYVGKLLVGFDNRGDIVRIKNSGLQRVAGGDQPDAVAPDPFIQRWVVDPVAQAVEALEQNVIAQTEVTLDGSTLGVRTRETNAGNLVADSLLWQAERLAGEAGVLVPDIALQNGGGIRNDLVIPPGDITELDTFTWLPFSNFVSVVENVERQTLLDILEHVVITAPATPQGRFAQIAGFKYSYDPDAPEGAKVIDAELDDGTALVQGGEVVPGPALTVATIDFLARGGDGYPFGDVEFTNVGASYQQALFNYLTSPDGLNGVVTAADYPEGGEGRIMPQ